MASPNEWLDKLNQLPELQKRIVTGLLLAVVALAVELAGGAYFTGFILLCAMLMILEWTELTRNESRAFRLSGFAYVLLPCLSLIMLRSIVFLDASELDAEMSPLPVLHLICIVAATDIGAYAAGKTLGRHKLAPSISPGKTWEGLIGGVLIAGVVSMSFAPFLQFPPSSFGAFLLGMLLGLIAQAGDLFESWLKRRAGVKDSGKFLPGHGGILDRVDGLMFVAPVYLLLAIMSGGTVL